MPERKKITINSLARMKKKGEKIVCLTAYDFSIYGGLKAVVWSDLIQGIALLAGGFLVMVLGFRAVGGVEVFFVDERTELGFALEDTEIGFAEQPD